MTEQTDAAEVGPYIGRSMAEIVDDYVMVRGDLTEQYARDQLLAIIAAREAAAEARGAQAVLAAVEEQLRRWGPAFLADRARGDLLKAARAAAAGGAR